MAVRQIVPKVEAYGLVVTQLDDLKPYNLIHDGVEIASYPFDTLWIKFGETFNCPGQVPPVPLKDRASEASMQLPDGGRMKVITFKTLKSARKVDKRLMTDHSEERTVRAILGKD